MCWQCKYIYKGQISRLCSTLFTDAMCEYECKSTSENERVDFRQQRRPPIRPTKSGHCHIGSDKTAAECVIYVALCLEPRSIVCVLCHMCVCVCVYGNWMIRSGRVDPLSVGWPVCFLLAFWSNRHEHLVHVSQLVPPKQLTIVSFMDLLFSFQ